MAHPLESARVHWRSWTRRVIASGRGWPGGFHSEKIVLNGKRVQRVTFPVPFEYRALGAALRSFLALGEAPYRLEGEVSVRGFGMGLEVPFHSEGVLKQ